MVPEPFVVETVNFGVIFGVLMGFGFITLFRDTVIEALTFIKGLKL